MEAFLATLARWKQDIQNDFAELQDSNVVPDMEQVLIEVQQILASIVAVESLLVPRPDVRGCRAVQWAIATPQELCGCRNCSC